MPHVVMQTSVIQAIVNMMAEKQATYTIDKNVSNFLYNSTFLSSCNKLVF